MINNVDNQATMIITRIYESDKKMIAKPVKNKRKCKIEIVILIMNAYKYIVSVENDQTYFMKERSNYFNL